MSDTASVSHSSIILWRWDASLLEEDIVNKSSTRLDETFTTVDAQSLVSKGKVGRNNALNLLSHKHVGNHVVDSINNNVSAEVKEQDAILSFRVRRIPDLSVGEISCVFNGNNIALLRVRALHQANLLLGFLRDSVLDSRVSGEDFWGGQGRLRKSKHRGTNNTGGASGSLGEKGSSRRNIRLHGQ